MKSQELAKLARISASEFSLIERQQRTPTLSTLGRLAKVLGVSAGYLLGELYDNLPLREALARESLDQFLKEHRVSTTRRRQLDSIASRATAPTTMWEWECLLQNARYLRTAPATNRAKSPIRKRKATGKKVTPYETFQERRENKGS